jgi:hypothetical protein
MKFTENYLFHVKKRPDFSSFTCPAVQIVDARTQSTGRPKKKSRSELQTTEYMMGN